MAGSSISAGDAVAGLGGGGGVGVGVVSGGVGDGVGGGQDRGPVVGAGDAVADRGDGVAAGLGGRSRVRFGLVGQNRVGGGVWRLAFRGRIGARVNVPG